MIGQRTLAMYIEHNIFHWCLMFLMMGRCIWSQVFSPRKHPVLRTSTDSLLTFTNFLINSTAFLLSGSEILAHLKSKTRHTISKQQWIQYVVFACVASKCGHCRHCLGDIGSVSLLAMQGEGSLMKGSPSALTRSTKILFYWVPPPFSFTHRHTDTHTHDNVIYGWMTP